MVFQRWMKYGLLTSALLAIPVQSAFALGGQWRPVNSVSPAAHSVDARLQRAAHARFRPVKQLRQPQALPQLSAPIMPPPPARPAAPQRPAFARQYSWRPAPTQYRRHQAPQQRRYVRHVPPRSNRGIGGAWRPVAGVAENNLSAAAPTGFGQSAWRPVQAYQAAPTQVPANTGNTYVSAPQPAPNPYPMPQPYAPRTGYPNPYMAQPYLMPAPIAAGFNPYAMPYVPAPHYALPYGRFQPMLPPPPAPAWGWQPPMYMPARPPMYAPAPPPSFNQASSLAGCPGC